MENFDRKERIVVDEFTIEHIMPQNENLSVGWQSDLGENWQTVQETWLHTLGNLTLTAYNSEYSDRTFQEKRDMEGGFKVSPLKLNEGLGQIDNWNEVEIQTSALSPLNFRVVDEVTSPFVQSIAGTRNLIHDNEP